MPYKQDYGKINQWQQENTDLLRIRARKEEHFPERIQLAIDAGKGSSRQAYILEAIREKLEQDGIQDIGEGSDV